MEQNDSTPKMVERLNGVPVSKRDLQRVLRDAEKQRKQGPLHGEAGMFIIIRLFHKTPAKAQAVYFRMLALANTLDEQELRAWVMRRDDGQYFTRDELIRAAAVCPLIGVNKYKIGFNRELLAAKALEFTSPEGRA